METAEVLLKAADLIEPEGAWTQGTSARAGAKAVKADDPSATCWCVVGALERVGSGANYDTVRRFLMGVLGVRAIVPWNDAPERTQAEVVATLRAAAEQLSPTPTKTED